MESIKFSVQFFGTFKMFGEKIEIETSTEHSVLEIKELLVKKLGNEHQSLITSSVLANETDILANTHVFKEAENLSILPPVCGG